MENPSRSASGAIALRARLSSSAMSPPSKPFGESRPSARLATVTDANLALGRLSPKGLLGGDMALDESLARKAIAPLAERLGFSIERTAPGLLRSEERRGGEEGKSPW